MAGSCPLSALTRGVPLWVRPCKFNPIAHPHRLASVLILWLVPCLVMAESPANSNPNPKADDMNVVRYEDFGAQGDGRTDDLQALADAHAYANEHQLPVRANDDATYRIGGRNRTIRIETDTHFGQARFVIDDTELENIKADVFEVRSRLKPIKLDEVKTLKRHQPKIDATLPGPCVWIVTDHNTKRFIRRGLNPNNGSSQTDVFLVDAHGNVDPGTPIIWDFDQITAIEVLPVDSQTLTITGGHFTTIANQAESKYNYHARGLEIQRSNVIVEGLEHHVTGEGPTGAPYRGFISVNRCANVTIRDTLLTGHKTYQTLGRAGRPVSMGSYDFNANRALNVSLVNVTQTNDIMDRRYWGIMGSNFCKNLTYDGCVLSRFDAHQGVVNATIRNSKIGYMGIKLIGEGTALIENTTVEGARMIDLRPDYGSTWRGDLVILNCTFMTQGKHTPALIGGSNDGQHDFGYTCYMPKKIVIENLKIDDGTRDENYRGPVIFANFNPRMKNADYKQPFPYVVTDVVITKGIETTSGKPLRLSDNALMFRDVMLTEND